MVSLKKLLNFMCVRVLQLGCHGSERCLHQLGPSGEKEIIQVQMASGRVFQFVFQLAGAECLCSSLFALSCVCGGEGTLLKWVGRARWWGLRGREGLPFGLASSLLEACDQGLILFS